MSAIKTCLVAVASSLVTAFMFTLYFDTAIADPFKTSLSTHSRVAAYKACLDTAVEISLKTDRVVDAKCSNLLGIEGLD